MFLIESKLLLHVSSHSSTTTSLLNHVGLSFFRPQDEPPSIHSGLRSAQLYRALVVRPSTNLLFWLFLPLRSLIFYWSLCSPSHPSTRIFPFPLTLPRSAPYTFILLLLLLHHHRHCHLCSHTSPLDSSCCRCSIIPPS